MKHHFADLLDRDGDYWTIIPNMERYAYSVEDIIPFSKDIKTATLGKHDKNWNRVLTLPNLEEVILHESSHE